MPLGHDADATVKKVHRVQQTKQTKQIILSVHQVRKESWTLVNCKTGEC